MGDDVVLFEPVLLALITADRVVEEKDGKKAICGTFTQFNAPLFPVQYPPWSVYASVTNVEGEHTFALNLTHSGTNQVVFSISGKCQSPSSENVLEFLFPIMGAVFMAPGNYHLTFDIDGRQVGSRLLKVVPTQMSPSQGG